MHSAISTIVLCPRDVQQAALITLQSCRGCTMGVSHRCALALFLSKNMPRTLNHAVFNRGALSSRRANSLSEHKGKIDSKAFVFFHRELVNSTF